jgi:anti-sigma factor RsiW
MSAADLTCQELVELVTDYFEGALAPEARQRFEAHVQGCDGCQAYVDQMRQTIRLAGELTPAQVSEAAQQRLLAAFRDWKRAG